MNLDAIPAGKNPPTDINVVIEITGGAGGGAPVKYEIDKDSGAVFVDRIVNTPMSTPATTASCRTRCTMMATLPTFWCSAISRCSQAS
jgi:hypothetical protein